MRRFHSGRALVVLSLVFALFVVPAAAQAAAPRELGGADAGAASVVERLWHWVMSAFDAGGPGLDPTRRPSVEGTGDQPATAGEDELQSLAGLARGAQRAPRG